MAVKLMSILLISTILFRPVMSAYMIIDYEINKDYISKYLCENKDRPELKCQGKCYLMQKLKKSAAEKEEQKTKHMSQISKIEVMALNQLVKFGFSNHVLFKILTPVIITLHNGYELGVFKPPIR